MGRGDWRRLQKDVDKELVGTRDEVMNRMGRMPDSKTAVKNMRVVALLAVVAVFSLPTAGCTKRSEETPGPNRPTTCSASPDDVPQIMSFLDDLDQEMFKDAEEHLKNGREIPDEEYDKTLNTRVRSRIASVSSPDVLSDLYVACEKKPRNPHWEPQEYLSVPSVSFVAQGMVLDRLAELGTHESAQALVRLAANPELTFDGEASLRLRCAVKSCGQNCLSCLRELQGEDILRVKSLIQMLERDEPCA